MKTTCGRQCWPGDGMLPQGEVAAEPCLDMLPGDCRSDLPQLVCCKQQCGSQATQQHRLLQCLPGDGTLPRGEVAAEPCLDMLPGDWRGDLPSPGGPVGDGEASSPSMSSMKASIHSVSRSFIISSRPASGIASCTLSR